MLGNALIEQATLKYGQNGTNALNDLFIAMILVPNQPLTAESLAVKLMELFTLAETALPIAQKQNNFGYSIAEGGQYRGTIKAAVVPNFEVVA